MAKRTKLAGAAPGQDDDLGKIIKRKRPHRRNRAEVRDSAQLGLEIVQLYNRLRKTRPTKGLQGEIARQLGVSPGTVTKHLDRAEVEWHEERVANMDEIKQAQLAELEKIKTEAWKEWARSKRQAESTTTKESTSEKGFENSKSTTKKGQTGGAQYLDAIKGAIAETAKLLGLYAPEKREVGNVDLNDLSIEQLERLEKGESLVAVLRDKT